MNFVLVDDMQIAHDRLKAQFKRRKAQGAEPLFLVQPASARIQSFLDLQRTQRNLRQFTGEFVILLDLGLGLLPENKAYLRSTYSIPDVVKDEQIDGVAVAVDVITQSSAKRVLIVIQSTLGQRGDIVNFLTDRVTAAKRGREITVIPSHGGYGLSERGDYSAEIVGAAHDAFAELTGRSADPFRFPGPYQLHVSGDITAPRVQIRSIARRESPVAVGVLDALVLFMLKDLFPEPVGAASVARIFRTTEANAHKRMNSLRRRLRKLGVDPKALIASTQTGAWTLHPSVVVASGHDSTGREVPLNPWDGEAPRRPHRRPSRPTDQR